MFRNIFRLYVLNKLMGGRGATRGRRGLGCGCLGLVLIVVVLVLLFLAFGSVIDTENYGF